MFLAKKKKKYAELLLWVEWITLCLTTVSVEHKEISILK